MFKKSKTKYEFPFSGILGHQKHPNVDGIMKKSLQGSIHI